jgi:hypothetical protein
MQVDRSVVSDGDAEGTVLETSGEASVASASGTSARSTAHMAWWHSDGGQAHPRKVAASKAKNAERDMVDSSGAQIERRVHGVDSG